MNMTLAKHLWRSANVRSALKKEALHLVACLSLLAVYSFGEIYVGKPVAYSIEMAIGGSLIVTLLWLAYVLSTVRVVLREHSQLKRKDVFDAADGDASCWTEQESSVMLKAATVSGEPVQLSKDEAIALGQALLKAADHIA
jgi:hypothetical protein